jgi:hypothetical protein
LKHDEDFQGDTGNCGEPGAEESMRSVLGEPGVSSCIVAPLSPMLLPFSVAHRGPAGEPRLQPRLPPRANAIARPVPQPPRPRAPASPPLGAPASAGPGVGDLSRRPAASPVRRGAPGLGAGRRAKPVRRGLSCGITATTCHGHRLDHRLRQRATRSLVPARGPGAAERRAHPGGGGARAARRPLPQRTIPTPAAARAA